MGRLVNFLFLIALMVMFVPGAGFATELDLFIVEEESAQQGDKKRGIGGIGVAAVPDYEGSSDYQAAPFVRLEYRWDSGRNFFMMGNTMRVNVLPNKKWNFGPALRYRAERDDVDNDVIKDMEKIDAAVEAGLFGFLKLDHWAFVLYGMQDVSDSHDGFVADFMGAYFHPLNPKAVLIPFAGLTYANDDYMETYFSVNDQNRGSGSSSTLPDFDASGDLKNVKAGLAMMYNPNEDWQIVPVAMYMSLLNDAKDSPVVDQEGDSGQFIGGVNFSYRF